MNVLWPQGSGTVQQVLEALQDKTELAYNSVLTTVRVLEKKGYVRHVKDGRAHIFVPLVGKAEASRFEVRHLVNRFFKNSHEALVLNILEDRSIDAQELLRMRELLRAGEQMKTDERPASREKDEA